jgi:hypothetical protein
MCRVPGGLSSDPGTQEIGPDDLGDLSVHELDNPVGDLDPVAVLDRMQDFVAEDLDGIQARLTS